MSEIRKPEVTFLLRKRGKKNVKIELFNAKDFNCISLWRGKRYRIRVNGKWYGAKGKGKGRSVYTRWEIRDLIWKDFPW